jgi:hypothetical protein
MNDIQQLIETVRQTGATLHADRPDLVLGSPELIPPQLKSKLREHKADILRLLELEASIRQLEITHILIAISDDGELRIVYTETDAHQAALDGFTIYSPKDAYMYVALSESERRLLHQFKKRFGGTTEWK